MATEIPSDFCRTLFQYASDGMAITDAHGILTSVNPAFETLFSHPAEHLEGKLLWSVFPLEQQETVQAIYEQVQTCAETSFEMIVPSAGASSLWLEVSVYFSEPLGSRTKVLLIVRDVTEKKHRVRRETLQSELHALNEQFHQLLAEQKKVEKALLDSQAELRKSQQLFESIAKNFPNGAINVLDRAYRIVFTDGEEYQELGINPAELIGQPIDTLFPNEDLSFYKTRWDKVFEGKRQQFEFEHLGRFYEHIAVPLPDEKGNISQILTVTLNITARKKAEAEAKEMQSRIQSLVDNLPGVTYQFVLEPNGQFYLTFLSEQAEKVFGLDRQVLLNDSSKISEYIFPDDRQPFFDAIQVSAQQMSQFHWLGRVVLPTQVIWTEAFSLPRKMPDGKIIWDGIQFNVTERIERDKQIQRFDEQLKLIVKNAPIVLWSLDKDGRFTLSEGKALEKIGFNAGDAVVFSAFELYSFNPTFIENLHKALAGEAIEFETYNIYLDQPVAFKHFLQPTRNEQGEVTGVLAISIDATEEYRAKENEARYRAIADNIPGAVFRAELQPDGSRKITFIGENIRLFGIEPNEMFGVSNTSARFLHPDDLKSFREAIDQSYQTMTPFRWEGRTKFVKKGKWIEVAATPRRADDGTIYWDGIILDITERKKLEFALRNLNELLEQQVQERTAELRQSEHLYRTIAENYPNGAVGIYDREFRLIFTDGTEYQRFGIDTKQLIGKSLYAIYPEAVAPIIAFYLTRAFEGETVSFETQIFEQDYFYYITPIREESGYINRVLAVVQNITERKKTERLLRENEERYRLVLEQTGQLVYDLDLTTNILKWSGAIEQLTGYLPSEYQISVAEWAEQIHPDDRNEAMRLLEETMESGLPYRVEYRYRRRDGSYFWVEDNGVYLKDESGKPTRMLGAMKDITAQKEMEIEKNRITEKALQAQKLEAIGTLASGIAHEFNNLLAIINLAGEQIQLQTKNAAILKNAQTIQKTVERGTHIARQLLDFSRSEQTEKLPVALSRLIDEITTTLRQLLRKNITVNAIQDVEQAWIMGNDKQLYQVLLNLGINAGDAMPDGGVLTYSLSTSRYNDKLCAVIRVQDTGTGIPPEVQARMFEPFFTTKGVGKGTGLGLSIVHGIVTAHEGQIEVASTVGKGTTFTLIFPLLDFNSSFAPEVPLSHEGGSETLLIVEDEPHLRMLLSKMLRSKGYKVLEASDGLEALTLFDKHKDEIHLVITDMGMPTMDGYQLLNKIQRKKTQAKVAVMSGYMDTEQNQRLAKAGVDVISKPFNFTEMLALIRSILMR
jgi:two-component system cell cycle sensor histidine kinase/response regulator CckA